MNTITRISRALAGLDISHEATQLDEIALKTRETEAARQRGQAKLTEIGAQLRRMRENNADGDAAARALRQGGDVAVVQRSEAALLAEQQAVRAGIAHLGRDLEQLRSESQKVRDDAALKIGAALDDLIDNLRDEAKGLAQRLAAIEASAIAIRNAVPSARATGLSVDLRGCVTGARGGGLAGRAEPDPAIIALLDQHRAKFKIAK